MEKKRFKEWLKKFTFGERSQGLGVSGKMTVAIDIPPEVLRAAIDQRTIKKCTGCGCDVELFGCYCHKDYKK